MKSESPWIARQCNWAILHIGLLWDSTLRGKTNTNAPRLREGAGAWAIHQSQHALPHIRPWCQVPSWLLLPAFLVYVWDCIWIPRWSCSGFYGEAFVQKVREKAGRPCNWRSKGFESLCCLSWPLRLSWYQEHAGMSLAAVKKVLIAAGFDVKNSSRIKLGLKSLVSKGTLVQTKGPGASGSLKLSKKATPEPEKGKFRKSC